jgi:hypothetical protein
MSVGKDFVTADKGKKFSKGGTMAKSDMKEDMRADLKQDKAMMQKAVNKHEGRLHKGEAMTKLAKGGSAKYMAFSNSGKPFGMKSVTKMASGGMAPSKMGAVKVGKTPDGVATKGKTKGTMIAMKRGGKC